MRISGGYVDFGVIYIFPSGVVGILDEEGPLYAHARLLIMVLVRLSGVDFNIPSEMRNLRFCNMRLTTLECAAGKLTPLSSVVRRCVVQNDIHVRV